MIKSDNSFEISVSHTTRKPRPNEVDGVDYHFVSKERFQKLIEEKAFYEHAKIFDNYYGTSKLSIKKINSTFQKFVSKQKKKVLELSNDKLVSIDFNHNSASAILDSSLTNVVGTKMGKISAWYDNCLLYTSPSPRD